MVGDSANNRVLIWNQLPTVNNQPADLCIGRSDYLSAIACTKATPASSPAYSFQGDLYVADSGSNRVLMFQQSPWRKTRPPVRSWGQPNLSARRQLGNDSAGTMARPALGASL